MSTFHEKIIRQGQALGYVPNSGGVCFGFTMKWIEASLTNQMDRFTQLTKCIENCESQQRVKDVRNKIKNKQEITNEEQLFLDLPAFYEGLLIYQSPNDYSELLGLTHQNNLEYTTLFASSKDIEDQQGLSTHSLSHRFATSVAFVKPSKGTDAFRERHGCV